VPWNSDELKYVSTICARVWVPPCNWPDQNATPPASPSRPRKSRYCCIAKSCEPSSVAAKMSLSRTSAFVPVVLSTPLGMPSASLSAAGSSEVSGMNVSKAADTLREQDPLAFRFCTVTTTFPLAGKSLAESGSTMRLAPIELGVFCTLATRTRLVGAKPWPKISSVAARPEGRLAGLSAVTSRGAATMFISATRSGTPVAVIVRLLPVPERVPLQRASTHPEAGVSVTVEEAPASIQPPLVVTAIEPAQLGLTFV
jgi:hypothetical protein